MAELKEFALFKDGVFSEVRRYPERPKDIPHKKVNWYPVGAPVEGENIGWSVVADEAVRTVKPKVVYVPHVLTKNTIWLRMTDNEVRQAQTKLEEIKIGAPKLYRLFSDSIELDHDEQVFFPQLKTIFVGMYGKDRTDELLKAER